MDKLSNELLLETLLYLDYYDLKRCMRVNRSFKAVTERPVFDKTLFRTKNLITEDSEIDLAELRVHPAFRCLHYTCTSEISDAEFLIQNKLARPDEQGNIRVAPLTVTCAANENATEPGLGRIRLDPYGGRWRTRISENTIDVVNKQGLTVLDVMKGLVRYYKNDDPSGWPLHRPYHSGHIFFEGWRTPLELDRDGTFTLQAYWGS